MAQSTFDRRGQITIKANNFGPLANFGLFSRRFYAKKSNQSSRPVLQNNEGENCEKDSDFQIRFTNLVLFIFAT
jgi:hypothetical protein